MSHVPPEEQGPATKMCLPMSDRVAALFRSAAGSLFGKVPLRVTPEVHHLNFHPSALELINGL